MNSTLSLRSTHWTRRRWLARVLTSSTLILGLSVSSIVAQEFPENSPRKAETLRSVRERTLKPFFKLLKQKKVPFNPKLLIDDRWRELLKEAFEQMPEMKQDLHIIHPMKGVYFASTLFLPEQVELWGDTLIIVRELVPEDENSAINIRGLDRIVIFVIGDTKSYQVKRRSRTSDLLRVDVQAPCAIVGVAPVLRPGVRCMGLGFFGKRIISV